MRIVCRYMKPVLKPSKPTLFSLFARATSRLAGRPATFTIAILVVALWAITGPVFDYSNAWQLTINTGTTIITFLMVFLIQATQNRDAEAIQVKLDEIIRSLDGAHNALLDLEHLEEEDLVRIHESYLKVAQGARERLRSGKTDTGVPEIVKAKPPPEKALSRRNRPRPYSRRKAGRPPSPPASPSTLPK
jgi:low affinity Fe/Cu permease